MRDDEQVFASEGEPIGQKKSNTYNCLHIHNTTAQKKNIGGRTVRERTFWAFVVSVSYYLAREYLASLRLFYPLVVTSCRLML